MPKSPRRRAAGLGNRPRRPLLVVANADEMRRCAGEYGINLSAADRVIVIEGASPATFASAFGRYVAECVSRHHLPRKTLRNLVASLSGIPEDRFTWDRVQRVVVQMIGKGVVRLVASAKDLLEARAFFPAIV